MYFQYSFPVLFSELHPYFFLFNCRSRRYASSLDVMYVQILSEYFRFITFISYFVVFFYQLGGKKQIFFYQFHHQVISADKTAYHYLFSFLRPFTLNASICENPFEQHFKCNIQRYICFFFVTYVQACIAKRLVKSKKRFWSHATKLWIPLNWRIFYVTSVANNIKDKQHVKLWKKKGLMSNSLSYRSITRYLHFL